MEALETLAVFSGLFRVLRSQWRDADAHRRAQQRALEVQLKHAALNVPFYRTSWKAAGVNPINLGSVQDLAELPILRRGEIQAYPDAFLAEAGDRERWRHSITSGSTGQPLETWFDGGCWGFVKYALKARRLMAYGWRPGHRVAIIEACASEALFQHALSNRLAGERWFGTRSYLSVFDPPEQHTQALFDFAPHFIYGFPSYFAALAKIWGPSLSRQVPLRALMTSGEWMHPNLRTRLEKVFGVPVLDVYGSTEFKEIAWQCPVGNGYHINMESVIVEILDDGGRAAVPGQDGEVVVTSLTNYAMPLFRYATGDRARRLEGPCACGRGLERMERIEGRVADYLRIDRSTVVSPYELTTAIEESLEVLEYKVTQVATNKVCVAVVLRPEIEPAAVFRIQESVSKRLRGLLEVEVNSVDSIPRAASGKHRPVEVSPVLGLRS